MENLIVIIHVLAGTTALIFGAWAIISKKGRGTHSKVGLIYSYAMYITCLLGIVSATLNFNSFFIAVGIFSFYLVYAGNRALFYWTIKEAYQPTKKDFIVTGFFLITGIFMLGYPIVKMILIGRFFVSVLAVFGLILLLSVWKDIQSFRDPSQFEVRNKKWLIRHISMMGGSYISAITAFSVNNIVIQHNWIIWLAPTVIGTILIARASSTWRKKLGLTTALLVGGVFALSADTQRVQGQVLSADSVPVAFVNIGIEGTSIGTISDEKGLFTLYVGAAEEDTEITFSHLAYETKRVAISQLKQHPKQTLKANAITLQMLEVTTKPTKEVVFGLSKVSTVLHTNYAISKEPNQNLGCSIGRKFNLSKGGYLKKLRIYASSNSFDTVWFRVSFYEAAFLGPGEPLYQKPIIAQVVGRKKGWIEIDLLEYEVYLKEKVFVSLEWIKHSKSGSRLSIPISMPMPGFTHYFRYGSQDDWKVYPAMATPIQLVALEEE